jgi:preprotein translocase SecE subunit
MAVAVKNAPVAAPPGLLARMPVVSLVGTAYVLASLAAVLWLLPAAWDALGVSNALARTDLPGVPNTVLVFVALLAVAAAGIFLAVRLGKRPGGAKLRTLLVVLSAAAAALSVAALGGGALLEGVVCVAALTALGWLGLRLLGAHAPAGSRAGIFAGLVGVLLALLLTRWASLWLEYWVFENHLFGDSGPTVGLYLTGAVGVALLVGLAWLLFRPGFDKRLTALEEQGWFSAAGYKPLQGQRVRRGTIVGLLLIAGTGVWTLMVNGPMRNAPPDWRVAIPFTQVITLGHPNDAVAVLQDLPDKYKQQVSVNDPGTDTGLPKGEKVGADRFRDALARAATADPKLGDDDKKALKDEIAQADVTALLDVADADPARLSAAKLDRLAVLPAEQLARLPTAFLVLDRPGLQVLNQALADKYVRVTKPNASTAYDPNLLPGALVPRKEFDDAVKQTREAKETPAEAGPATPAWGDTQSQTLRLLPALAYTVPLLLVALSVWLAWRVVNLPAFADFLIATEAELNKVSWTTRPRLIQDTIVVLVTVILLAGYLFLMDQTWRVVLSLPLPPDFKHGVLQFPDENSDTNKNTEQKRW